MSAIWGIISTDVTINTERLSLAFTDSYKPYKIDRFSSQSADNAIFGCCQQFFTEEASKEELPIYDASKHILFTADCVLDNRPELLTEFPQLSAGASDGQLLYAAYLKWGDSVCDHLLGAFSFAAYHTDSKTLRLFTDHMGNRSLFYRIGTDFILFSTLIAPLAKVSDASVSEKWLSACLTSTSADMMLFENLTPFQDILQMPAAGILIWSASGSSRRIYWDSHSIRGRLPHKAPEQYRELFLSTLTLCTESTMRSAGRIGCTLSGGLDSSAIAALAASKLEAQNSFLYSYTSVPLDSFPGAADTTEIFNETDGVLATCKQYPNIIPHFLSCAGKDAFTELERLVPLLGYPMKSGHNLTWLDSIYAQAYRDGCRLMLKGQYGNCTISWGKALSVFYQLLCAGHPFLAGRLMKGFGRQYHVARKRILKYMLTEWKDKFTVYPPASDDILTSEALFAKYRLQKTYQRSIRRAGGGEMDSRQQRLAFIFNPTAQMQLGMFDTAMSLIHGVLIRDPSKDKRIVEFCCRLPVECGLSGYVERGMIRTYMEGIVPDSIRNDWFRRGVQSADYEFRSKQQWNLESQNILAFLNHPRLRRYADPEKLDALCGRLSALSTEELTFDYLRKANVLYSCSIFLNHAMKEF